MAACKSHINEKDLYDTANNPPPPTKKPQSDAYAKGKKDRKAWNPKQKGPNFSYGEKDELAEKISNISTNNSERLRFLEEESILSLEKALYEPTKSLEFRILLPHEELSFSNASKLMEILEGVEGLERRLPRSTVLALKIRVVKEWMAGNKGQELGPLLDSLYAEFDKAIFTSV